MKQFIFIVLVVCFSGFISGAAVAQELPEVDGVLGLSRVTSQTSIAVWIPMVDGTVLSGVKWYQNDSQVIFPKFRVVAGSAKWPRALSAAVEIAQNVESRTLGWSELRFSQSVTSETSGLYLVFSIPEGAQYVGDGLGGGFGIGYCKGNGTHQSWVTGDGVNWNPIHPDSKLAIEPVFSVSKSSVEILHLSAPLVIQQDRVEVFPKKTPRSFLTASPNPFNPQTEIKFSLPVSRHTKIAVYDIRGYLVAELVNENLTEGEHRIIWTGVDQNQQNVASGTYLVKLMSGSLNLTQRLMLLK